MIGAARPSEIAWPAHGQAQLPNWIWRPIRAIRALELKARNRPIVCVQWPHNAAPLKARLRPDSPVPDTAGICAARTRLREPAHID